jgi:hypothetical protein
MTEERGECVVTPITDCVVRGEPVFTFMAKLNEIRRPYFSKDKNSAISNRAKLVKTLKDQGFSVLFEGFH